MILLEPANGSNNISLSKFGINCFHSLKSLNPNLTYKEIIHLFVGEFEQEFITVIDNLDESDITYEKLSKMFI